MPAHPPAAQIERIRTLSECAQQLTAAHDKDAGRLLGQARRAAPRLAEGCAAAGATRQADGRAAAAAAAAPPDVAGSAGACRHRACRRAAAWSERLFPFPPPPPTPFFGSLPLVPWLPQKMAEELFALPLEEALPIVRAFGHYLK